MRYKLTKGAKAGTWEMEAYIWEVIDKGEDDFLFVVDRIQQFEETKQLLGFAGEFADTGSSINFVHMHGRRYLHMQKYYLLFNVSEEGFTSLSRNGINVEEI